LSTIGSFNNGKWEYSFSEDDNRSISLINTQIRSDISTHLDKAMKIAFQKEGRAPEPSEIDHKRIPGKDGAWQERLN
jgi:hypothetical protein